MKNLKHSRKCDEVLEKIGVNGKNTEFNGEK